MWELDPFEQIRLIHFGVIGLNHIKPSLEWIYWKLLLI